MKDYVTTPVRSHTQHKLPAASSPRLLQLDSKSVKNALNHVSPGAALQYLADLFKGNGWTVAFTDAGYSHALLLSDPRHPDTVLLIVKFLNAEHELTYQEARDELIDFENSLSVKYKCSQFAIVALKGISRQAESLERFNLLLQDWDYVQELIDNYSPDKIKEPRIQLFAHNKQTYRKVQRMMKSQNSIAVVQATGTGKSFLIARLLQDFTGQKRLVMAPSIYVIDQVKEHIRWDAANIEYMTYARSMNLSQSEIAALNPAMIVLDEFHRCGAEEWGRGVQNILNAYPGAFKLGTSATPVRHMDNGRDMSIELFNNNVAENLSLSQAIVRNILPMPKYVCALYTLTEERDLLRDKINRSRSAVALKKRMQLDLDAASIDWERSHGIPVVLKKYLQPYMKKFIVFCKDEQHLLEMEPVVSAWFATATGSGIKTYRIYDGEPKSFDNLKSFKAADDKAVHLLLSINMLNEGLHVNEVGGVVLLRPTESPNIFYQQIGRCLKVGLSYSPVIFDFVNNFKSIRTYDFLYDLEFAHSQYAADRSNENLEDRCPAFTIIDEVREITEVFGEIKFRLDDWEGQFQRLVEYKERFGSCNVPGRDPQYKSLSHWLRMQRKKIERNLIEPGRKVKLLKLGVDMSEHKFEGWQDEVWEKRFNELNAFRLQYGHCYVPSHVDKNDEFGDLRKFIDSQRRRNVLGVISEYRKNKLLSIGFEFESNFLEGRWQSMFDELVAYKNKHDHFIMYNLKGTALARWTTSQRKKFTRGTLDEQRKQKLNNIGFTWSEDPQEIFDKKFEELIVWYEKNKNFNIPVKSKLGHIVNYVKKRYRLNTLSEEKVKLLKSMSFNFSLAESRIDSREKRVQQVEQFFKRNGHAHITERNETHKGLNNWLKIQRKLYKQKALTDDVITRMEAAGVDWYHKKNRSDNNWNASYEQLIQLKKETGKLTPPVDSMKSLSAWCALQRLFYTRGKLSHERIKKLEAIGFKWVVQKDAWEERYKSLVQFYKVHGHSSVNSKSGENTPLGSWSIGQRTAYKNGKLLPDQIRRLESLNFIWDVAEYKWHTKYTYLKDYVQQYGWEGICTKNTELFNWISTQRADYKKKRLPEDKIMLLNMLGVNWLPQEEHWDKMFGEFVQYRQTHESGRVSHADKSHRELWTWCTSQRGRYRRNTLPEENIKLLADAGFEFELKSWNGQGKSK